MTLTDSEFLVVYWVLLTCALSAAAWVLIPLLLNLFDSETPRPHEPPSISRSDANKARQ